MSSEHSQPEEPLAALNETGEEQVQPEQVVGSESGAPTVESAEAQLPPEARGEMNGGPLGCCLGVTVGLLLSVSVPLISRFWGDPLIHLFGGGWLSLLVRILMGLVAFVAVVICGRLGWRIGMRIYKEYPAPVVKRRGKR